MRLSIGVIFAGPEVHESAAASAAIKIMRHVKSKRGEGDEHSAGLNIVFHIAGSLVRPDWEGVLAAKFSKKRKLLMIQAAVPEKMVSSENIGPFLCELMRQGAVAAKPVFEKAGIPFDEAKCTEFVTAIERELGWRR